MSKIKSFGFFRNVVTNLNLVGTNGNDTLNGGG